MKKRTLYLMIATVVVATLAGCKSSKKAAKVAPEASTTAWQNQSEDRKIVIPCSGEKYGSTKEQIRANGIGESMDLQMAKRMSRQAAMEDMGTKIGATVSSLIIDYYKSVNVNMTEDLKRRFEGGTDIVVKERISGYRTICEEYTQNSQTKNYKAYMAIELDAADMAKAIHKKLSDEQILRTDYEFEQFRKRFDDELKKMENSR